MLHSSFLHVSRKSLETALVLGFPQFLGAWNLWKLIFLFTDVDD